MEDGMLKQGDLVMNSYDAKGEEKQYWRRLMRLGRHVLKDVGLFAPSKKELTMAQRWIVESKAKLKALGGV